MRYNAAICQGCNQIYALEILSDGDELLIFNTTPYGYCIECKPDQIVEEESEKTITELVDEILK